MKEIFRLSWARKIQRLLDKKRLNYNDSPKSIMVDLLNEDIVVLSIRGAHKRFLLEDAEGLRTYLSQRYEIGDSLEQWIEIMTREEEVSRAEQVRKMGDSKRRNTRAFKGFPLNCYTPIEATLRDELFVISPMEGASIFLEDYEYFRIPEDVVVVGLENGANFQHIRAQRYLFEGMKVLFVSRYPQSKDLRTWLGMIPNRYIHFGDFDLAGISIFQTEYYTFLGDRAEFFIPADVEQRLETGSRMLYDKQYARYGKLYVSDNRLQRLVWMIHQHKRGYEQEGYIEE